MLLGDHILQPLGQNVINAKNIRDSFGVTFSLPM
jgi:hypothetical protein